MLIIYKSLNLYIVLNEFDNDYESMLLILMNDLSIRRKIIELIVLIKAQKLWKIDVQINILIS